MPQVFNTHKSNGNFLRKIFVSLGNYQKIKKGCYVCEAKYVFELLKGCGVSHTTTRTFKLNMSRTRLAGWCPQDRLDRMVSSQNCLSFEPLWESLRSQGSGLVSSHLPALGTRGLDLNRFTILRKTWLAIHQTLQVWPDFRSVGVRHSWQSQMGTVCSDLFHQKFKGPKQSY